MHRSWSIVLLFLLLSHIVNAQTESLRFKRIGVEDGLSSNNVLRVLQDDKGIMWLGTTYGLNSYDSYAFRYFNSARQDSLSISDDVVSTIYQDKAGALWVGTGNGIDRYNKEKGYFDRFSDTKNEELGSNYIRVFYEDGNGRLWVGSSRGLFYFDQQQKRFVRFGDAFGESLRVNTIKEDAQGRLLVGTLRGVLYVDGDKFEKFHLQDKEQDRILKNSEVRSIVADTAGALWLATEGAGIFKVLPDLTAQHLTIKSTDGELLSNVVRVITITKDGNLWIGGQNGLNIYHPDTKKFDAYRHNIYDHQSLSFNSIRDIFEDSFGGIWIATYGGGLNYYNPASNLFHLIQQRLDVDNTLSDNQITTISVTENKNLWLGTHRRGISQYDLEKETFTHLRSASGENSLIDDDIKSISADSLGNLWIGTYDGLSYYDTKAKKFSNYSLTTFDSLNPLINQVHTTLIDHKGNLWAGTNGAGLLFFNLKNNKWEHHKHVEGQQHSLSTNHINVLYEDSKNNLWVGMRSGLDVLSYGSGKFRHTALKDVKIQSLLEDDQGFIWAGSNGEGLYLYKEDGTYFNYRTEDGLAGNVVYALLKDEDGNVWMSTNNGLTKMNINRDAQGNFKNVDFINYKSSDGLQGNQFMPNSAFRAGDGKMYFGGINGLNYFYPKEVPTIINFPPVTFTGLKIKNQEVLPGMENSPLVKKINYSEKIELHYDQSEFTVDFTALNYISPNKSLYAYKLEGFDTEWNYIGKQHNATFTYPPAGDYELKVKASTNPNRWPYTYTSIKIHIQPPLWRTTWAYMLYALIIVLLFYGYHKITGNFIKLKREKELSKSKFEFFTNISHEIKTPLTLILSPLEELIKTGSGDGKMQYHLDMMKRNGDRLVNLINQLLDYRKFESGAMQLHAAKGNMVRFTKEIYLSFKALADRKNITFELQAPEHIDLYYDRDKLEKVLLNLLSNAFKFTEEGGSIRIVINEHTAAKNKNYKNGYCSICIEDTGLGISPEKLKAIFKRFVSEENYPAEHTGTGIGLNLAKRLVKMHGGEIKVKSQPAESGKKGSTSFKVRLPLGTAHLKEDQILTNFKDSEEISQYLQYTGEDHQKLYTEEVLKAEKSPKKDKLMLIVEDNADVRDFVSSIFSGEYKIIQAGNGVEGLQQAFEVIPDLIISDVMMPIMDGITLCSTLKNDNRTSHIPIILLTARTPLVFRIEGIETGADDYVTKPFSPIYLKSRVRNLINNREKIKEKFRKELILQPKQLTVTSPDEKFLETVLAYLDKHMDDPNLSVEDISKEAGMSRSNLYRKIKALTGLTIVQFIRSIRIKRAAQLLAKNGFNVSEVAYMVGFQDVDYFTRCFKKEFKVVPSKYEQVLVD